MTDLSKNGSKMIKYFQEETALRLVESSLRTPEYRPINIFVNFYSGISTIGTLLKVGSVSGCWSTFVIPVVIQL